MLNLEYLGKAVLLKQGRRVDDQLIVYGSWHSSASSFKSTAAVNTAPLAKLKCRPTCGIFCSRVLELIFGGVKSGISVDIAILQADVIEHVLPYHIEDYFVLEVVGGFVILTTAGLVASQHSTGDIIFNILLQFSLVLSNFPLHLHLPIGIPSRWS